MTSHSEERVVKVCRKCGQQKSLNDFYHNKDTADGHLSQCIECHKAYKRSYRAQHAEKIRDYMQNYAYTRKSPHTSEARKKWRRTERGKESWAATYAKYQKANPERIAARMVVHKAIKAGLLDKQPCSVCGSTQWVQAHHDDYNCPLCVTWLCVQHHTDLHRLRRRRWFQLELSL